MELVRRGRGGRPVVDLVSEKECYWGATHKEKALNIRISSSLAQGSLTILQVGI